MSGSNYSDFITQDARLIILKELATQSDGRLNEVIMLRVLDQFGHRRSRAWIAEQYRFLEDIKAVTTQEVGSVLVAQITQIGQDHLERRELLEGIALPSIGS